MRIRILEADAAVPFPDDRFQISAVAFGLRNVTDTDRGIAEMVRVTQPGGRVAILEFSKPKGWIGSAYRFYFRQVLPKLGQLISRSREGAYDYLPRSVLEFPDGEELAERLRSQGLIEVSWHPMTFGIATVHQDEGRPSVVATSQLGQASSPQGCWSSPKLAACGYEDRIEMLATLIARWRRWRMRTLKPFGILAPNALGCAGAHQRRDSLKLLPPSSVTFLGLRSSSATFSTPLATASSARQTASATWGAASTRPSTTSIGAGVQ